MDTGLKDEWVFIAGSSKGIGYGIAEKFLEDGANVVITGRDCSVIDKSYEVLVEKYNDKSVLKFCGDLLDETFVATIAKDLENKQVNLSHIICNVGSGKTKSLIGQDISEFQKMLDINFLASVNVTLGIGKLLFRDENDLKCNRTITYISSICSKSSIGCPIAYASAKAALDAYAKNMSNYLSKYGIRVNLVSPGNILFPGSTWEDKINTDEDAVKRMLSEKVPLNKLGDINDIASLVIFLSSKHASFITGADFIVDGGQLNIT